MKIIITGRESGEDEKKARKFFRWKEKENRTLQVARIFLS